MTTNAVDENALPAFDQELIDIADYVTHYEPRSDEAYHTARLCVMDTLGCGILALRYPECIKHLGAVVPGTYVPHATRVPGTQFTLDPILAAFNIGVLNRWLDYNDTWLAAEWGHPSDNLAGILAVSDHLSRVRRSAGQAPLTLRHVLTALIKAYEIQGVLALENSFNRVGLDHVILVKVASTAVVSQLLGATPTQLLNALSLAWVDGQSLRTYRHAPNTGSRKSWAAGDASARAVQLAYMAIKGEAGYPSVLSAPKWGFYDVSFAGKKFKLPRPYASYVIENILFKIAYPAEFHAQTAAEAAISLHPSIKHRLDQIDKISITTQESAVRIISKTGPLHNPADRDHCLQYIVAIGLLYGELTADHYEDHIALDPRIDRLRAKMHVSENHAFSADYLDPNKRSIANSLQIHFTDGSQSAAVSIDYPIGHRRRRAEGIPLLENKFQHNLATRFPKQRVAQIMQLCSNQEQFEATAVDSFMDMFWI